MVITMTAGTGLIMWMGELITERGIGNGMSLLIFTSIAATLPELALGDRAAHGLRDVFIVVIAVGLLIMVGRRLRRAVAAAHPRAIRETDGRPAHLRRQQHLHPDQGQHGRRRARHLRLVAAVPAGAHRAVQPAARPASSPQPWVVWITNYLTTGDHPLYMLLYFLLIVGFTYFYVAITFNPEEVADNMKKYGGFIPGIRAGRPTAEYLDYVLTRITLPGSLYLGLDRAHPADRARAGRRQPRTSRSAARAS